MPLTVEDYFDFQDPDGIRFPDRRIWIEHVLYQYIYNSRTAEVIQKEDFPSLSLEQVYAAILYYLHNKEAMTKYVVDWLERGRTAREEARKKDPEFYEKWGRRKAEFLAGKKHQIEA
jgi:uncharacterized protein (DUF433 family)